MGRQILYDATDMWLLTVTLLKSEWWLPGAAGGEMRSYYPMTKKFQLSKMSMF